jgi:hypothetical protein
LKWGPARETCATGERWREHRSFSTWRRHCLALCLSTAAISWGLDAVVLTMGLLTAGGVEHAGLLTAGRPPSARGGRCAFAKTVGGA